MNTAFFFRISIFWLGLSYMWGALNIQFLPYHIPQIVPVHLQGTAIGLIVFVGLLTAIAVQPIAGAISDRATFKVGRRRPFMVVGIFLSIPLVIVVGISDSLSLLLITVIFLQIAANVAQGPYQGIIPDLVNPSARGRASGFFGMANLAGTMIGAGIAGLFIASNQPVWATVSIALVLLMTTLFSWFAVSEPVPIRDQRDNFESIRQEVLIRISQLRKHEAFMWMVFSRLMFFMGLQAMDNFLRLFIADGLGESDPEIKTTVVLAAVIVMALIVSAPAGYLADRYGRLLLVAASCICGVVGALLLLLSQSFSQVVFAAGVVGVGLGGFTVSDWAIGIDLLPDRKAPGLYMGITNLGQAGGDALATLSAGIVLDLFNHLEPGLGYRAIFTMMAIFFVTSCVLLGVVRNKMT